MNQVRISLIVYPSTESTIMQWQTIPRKGEYVFYNEKKYQVSDVWHSMDLVEIKVFLMPTR